jgi:hypothetical protein
MFARMPKYSKLYSQQSTPLTQRAGQAKRSAIHTLLAGSRRTHRQLVAGQHRGIGEAQMQISYHRFWRQRGK